MEFTKFLAILLGCYVIYYLIAFLSELMSMKPQPEGADPEANAVHYEIEKPVENTRDIVVDSEDTTPYSHGNMSNPLSYNSNKLLGFDLGMEQFSEGIAVEPEEFSKLRMA